MTDAATKSIISASLVDVRNIAAHKCVRLEIHVPVEQAGEVMTAFGWPTMAEPVPVAIARLDLSKSARQIEPPRKERRPFKDMPLPQQIALRCNDENFWRFLNETGADAIRSEDDCAQYVRAHCRVGSRSEIQPDTEAARLYAELDAEFYAWQRGPQR